MKKRYLALAAALPALLLFSFSRSKNPLEECWKLQVEPARFSNLALYYDETANELHHSSFPWEQTTYQMRGTAWFNAVHFLKADTITNRKSRPVSALDYSPEEMLLRDFGDKDLAEVTPEMHREQFLQIARYTPALMLDYFHLNHPVHVKNEKDAVDRYRADVNGTLVEMTIAKDFPLVQEISWLSHHAQFGDARTSITYQSYVLENGVYTPHRMLISKINGKVRDTVTVTASSPVTMLPVLLARPNIYAMKPAPVKAETLTVNHYNEHIHFVEFSQADSRSLVVEFNDFLVIAEAPLSSENGELLIQEAKKIAPGKPIKYFLFGHYHPHYLGGVRPFIHKRATILTVADDQEFVRYIAQAPRSLHPDSLFLQPVPLITEIMGEKKSITDGTYSMEVHFIGEQSGHTKDYLVYYFPAEKMLFEDDLVWIPKNGEARKAGNREKGLHDAVKRIGLPVDTVVQGWPVNNYDVKTIFPFAELEKMVQ